MADIKAELDAQMKLNREAIQRPAFNFKSASDMRAAIKEAVASHNEAGREALEDMAVEAAESMEQLTNTAVAKRWFSTATATGDTLLELMDKFLASKDFKASTNHAHRLALKEVLAFMKMEDAVPSSLTRTLAVRYFDDSLTQRGLAKATISDRLASLGGFWKYMASRGVVRADDSPWSGFSISDRVKGRRAPVRPYTDSELVRLLQGHQKAAKWPTMRYLPDLMVLGMYTGARIEELCSLTAGNVQKTSGGYILTIARDKTKTDAGERPLGVTSTAPVAVLERRLKGLKTGDRLFPELSEGGLDDKFSASASKAFGRYRLLCLGEAGAGTDFHSFRRCVATKLERADATERQIARFIGHRVGTVSGDIYSGGSDNAQSLTTSKLVVYSDEVEEMAKKAGAALS